METYGHKCNNTCRCVVVEEWRELSVYVVEECGGHDSNQCVFLALGYDMHSFILLKI